MVILALAQLPATSRATSCAPIRTLIYGDCENAACERVVFVDSESGYGTCARSPVIVEGSSLHERILEDELATLDLTGKGTYEIELERRWYFPGYRLESLGDYREIYGAGGEPAHARKGASSLQLLEGRTTERMADHWRREGERQRDRQRSRMSLDIALVGIGIVPMVASAVIFRRGMARTRGARALTGAFALSIAAFAYGFALIATGFRFGAAGAWCIVLGSLLITVELFLLAVVSLFRLVAARLRP